MKSDRRSYGLLLMIGTILIYALLFILYKEKIKNSFNYGLQVLWNMLPIFVFIIILMWITNLFVNKKTVSKYLGKESGYKGLAVAIIGGIISHGAIYVWYPFLKELKDKGMKSSLIAVFLYNRAVKIPLLPVLIYYFGLDFTAVLIVFTIIASIIEGKIFEGMRNTGILS